ncbi:hypothetical protein REPUB_Repub17cG0019900 [Reevesia pubescens]
MELNLVPISITKQKQDSGGNHCQVFKNGDRLQIKFFNTLEPDSTSLVLNGKREVSQGSRAAGRKRGRDRSLLTNTDSCAKTDLALVSKGVESPVHMAIGRFLYDIGVNSNAVNSVYFQPMIDAIASGGSGIVPPSSQDLWGWILKKVIEEVKDDID